MEQSNNASRRNLLRVLAVSAGLWGLSGPIVSNALAQTRGTGKPLTQLRIGYQKSAVKLVILKQQVALERRFPNAQIKWIDFPAGPQLLEALAMGSLDFGMTGDSPPVFAQAADKDLVYVGAEPAKSESSAILVTKDSPTKQLAELKGKRIALQKGSSSQYLLISAVEKAGLLWTDILPIYLAPAEARAALESKSVDAWAIWDPFYAANELAVAARLLTTGTGLSNSNSFYLASRAFATDYPEVLAVLFEELTRADQVLQQRRLPWQVSHITPRALQSQQQVADGFQRLSLIPNRIEVAGSSGRPNPLCWPKPIEQFLLDDQRS
jgi:sulfonate transport system substrate-binding protein